MELYKLNYFLGVARPQNIHNLEQDFRVLLSFAYQLRKTIVHSFFLGRSRVLHRGPFSHQQSSNTVDAFFQFGDGITQ